jgi:deoxyribose-phosphate aldolase
MNNLTKQLTPESLAQYFDHTLLKPFATVEAFEQFCVDSAKYKFKMVAINPAPVRLCKKLLEGSGVRVGAAIGFPFGQNTVETKVFETQDSIDNGADEIDYVINITELKYKNYDYIEREMAGIVGLCKQHNVTSKVIFENCFLTDAEKKELCRIALNVGPDFIKTSTGFGTGGATLEDVALMKSIVGDKIKVKAAGGIRTLDMVLQLIDLGVERIGSTASIEIVNAFIETL